LPYVRNNEITRLGADEISPVAFADTSRAGHCETTSFAWGTASH